MIGGVTAEARRRADRQLALLAAGVFVLVTLGRFASTEMFLDGVTYAALARNLAAGQGSFWAPRYSDGAPVHFHPPLGFWLESLAFAAFGGRPWVERAFGVACGAATLALTALLWRRLWRERGLGWWPLLLLLLAPLASWCWANNLLEDPFTVFALAALVAVVEAMAAPPRLAIVLGLAAGALTGGALLVKGPPALFLVAAPWCLAIADAPDRRRRAWLVAAALALGVGTVAAAAALGGGTAARTFWHDYVVEQLRPSALGQRERASSHLLIVTSLLRELSLSAIVAWAMTQGSLPPRASRPMRLAAALLACALTASVPFIAFVKQMDWYLMPSLPLFALALACATQPAAAALRDRLAASTRGGALVTGLAVAGAALGIAGASGAFGRVDVALPVALRDAWTQGAADTATSEHAWRDFRHDFLGAPLQLPAGVRVVSSPVRDYSRLVAYVARYFGASVVPAGRAPFIVREHDADDGPILPPTGCRAAQQIQPRRFFLFACD